MIFVIGISRLIFIEAFGFALRALVKPVRVSFLGLAILLAVMAGPYATLILMDPLSRFVYWAVTVVMASFVVRYISAVLGHFVQDLLSWRMVVVKSLLMGLFFSPLIYVWTLYMVQPLADAIRPYGFFIRDVVLITMAILITRKLVFERGIIPPRRPVAQSAPAVRFDALEGYVPMAQVPVVPIIETTHPPVDLRPRLLRRIDGDDPGPVIRLEALDHFVTAVTARGHYQLRMRFADAVAEMDATAGFVTHRSHWVARDGIIGATRSKGKVILTASDGTQVPVSRTYQIEVEEMLGPLLP